MSHSPELMMILEALDDGEIITVYPLNEGSLLAIGQATTMVGNKPHRDYRCVGHVTKSVKQRLWDSLPEVSSDDLERL